jgi:tetratricopeptide (TPR) repeat protein
MPPVARAQGQVCAQHPTTANPTRQQGLSNGGNPFQDPPHPSQDPPHPPPERPNLTEKFLGRRVAAGLALVEHGVEQEVASDRPRRLALFVAWLSEAYLLAGRLEEARQRAAQALDLARQYKQRGQQAWALWLLGESTARQASPEIEPAAGHYHQALALAEELGMRPLQAHCHRGLGMLYAQTDQRELARAALAAAIDLYRGMQMTFWLPQAEAALRPAG